MRLVTICALLLAINGMARGDDASPPARVTVQVVGSFVADKDTTLNYVLKKGGRVVSEEKGLTGLPGKPVEVDLTAPGGWEVTVSANGGVLRVQEIGLLVTAHGRTWKGTFPGQVSALNASDACGFVVRAVTVPMTLTPVPTTPMKPEEKKPEPKKEEPKKEEPKKDEPKNPENKKPADPKDEPKKDEQPKKDEPKQDQQKPSEEKQPVPLPAGK